MHINGLDREELRQQVEERLRTAKKSGRVRIFVLSLLWFFALSILGILDVLSRRGDYPVLLIFLPLGWIASILILAYATFGTDGGLPLAQLQQVKTPKSKVVVDEQDHKRKRIALFGLNLGLLILCGLLSQVLALSGPARASASTILFGWLMLVVMHGIMTLYDLGVYDRDLRERVAARMIAEEVLNGAPPEMQADKVKRK